MEPALLAFLPGLFIWIAIGLLPWRPWSTSESLEADPALVTDYSAVTILIPARNEGETIAATLSAIKAQATDIKVILVNDESTDNTLTEAESVQLDRLTIVNGKPLPEGWSGKLWALEQGRQHVDTPLLLLLDADIILKPGLIASVIAKADKEQLQLLSLMAFLKMESGWEKFLMPAFIFFFKLLYPFKLSNRPTSKIAAAAGGFILLNHQVLKELGGFSCIKHALIDDCSLASKVKQKGYKTWTGLTHSACSIRSYNTLSTIWQMVRRTAYTQLFYSPLLLMLCTALMLFAFLLPLLALVHYQASIFYCGLFTLVIQVLCYLPTLRYYDIPAYYALSLPFAGILYLLMTWDSAFQHYFASGASWKGRHYS